MNQNKFIFAQVCNLYLSSENSLFYIQEPCQKHVLQIFPLNQWFLFSFFLHLFNVLWYNLYTIKCTHLVFSSMSFHNCICYIAHIQNKICNISIITEGSLVPLSSLSPRRNHFLTFITKDYFCLFLYFV